MKDALNTLLCYFGQNEHCKAVQRISHSVRVLVFILLMCLFGVPVFAANNGYTDIGATPAETDLLGSIVIPEFSATQSFEYTGLPVDVNLAYDYLPKVAVAPVVKYEGINGTTYTASETAPTDPGSYKVYLEKPEGWVFYKLDGTTEDASLDFEITQGVIKIDLVKNDNIDCYSFSGRAITSHVAKFGGTEIAGTWSMTDSNVCLAAGAHTRSLVFTPTNAVYGTVATDVVFNVNKIDLTGKLTPTSTGVTYETKLVDIPLLHGEIKAGLDEEVIVGGDFKFDGIGTETPDAGDTNSYNWTFTPSFSDSFVSVTGSAGISVAPYELIFGTDVDFVAVDRVRQYKDRIDGRTPLALNFTNPIRNCLYNLTYAKEGTTVSDIEDAPVGTYSVTATVTNPLGNYTFDTETGIYTINPRPIAYFEVDTKRTYSVDDIRSAVTDVRAFGVETEGVIQGQYTVEPTDPNNTITDSWYELLITYTPNINDAHSANYGVTDTRIMALREKTAITIANVRASEITYPDVLSMANIVADPLNNVTFDIAFKDSLTILEYKDSCIVQCGWRATPTGESAKNFTDSEGFILVSVNQKKLIPSRVKTSQEFGSVEMPILEFAFDQVVTERDTAPYHINFTKNGASISHHDFLKGDAGDYYATFEYDDSKMSNYKFDTFENYIPISQVDVTTNIVATEVYVGNKFSTAIKSYEVFGPDVDGNKINVEGSLALENGDEPATKSGVQECIYVFTPKSANYMIGRGSLYVRVIAGGFPIKNVIADKITYGQQLIEANLTMESDVKGTIEWEKPNHYPTVADSGKDFKYIATPFDTENYRTVTGTIKISVDPYNLEGKNHIVIKDPINPIFDGKSKLPVFEVTNLSNEKFADRPNPSVVKYDPNDRVNVGNVNVTATYTGNYIGKIQGSFKIYPNTEFIAITDTQKIYTAGKQVVTITGIDGSAVKVDSVIYTSLTDSKQYDTSGVIAADIYDVKAIFSQGSATWSLSDSFIIAKKEVIENNINFASTIKQYDGAPLDILFAYNNLNPIPTELEYIKQYSDSVGTIVNTMVDTGTYYVSLNFIGNFTGRVDTVAIINPIPYVPPIPPIPPEPPRPPTPVVPPTPPVPPPVIVAGTVGFTEKAFNSDISDDVIVGVCSKLTAESSVIIHLQRDELLECDLYINAQKVDPVGGYYLVSLAPNESKWLTVRSSSKAAFKGTKSVQLKMTVASTASVKIPINAVKINYTSNMLELSSEPIYSVTFDNSTKLPDTQYLDIVKCVREDQQTGVEVFVPAYTTQYGAMVHVEAKSASSVGPLIVYDYSTMKKDDIDNMIAKGISDVFYCELYDGKNVTKVLVTVATGKAYVIGTGFEIKAEELDISSFKSTPSSKGYYYDPYEKVKLGAQPKARKISMKMTKVKNGTTSMLTVAGNVPLENKRLMNQERKFKFLRDIVDADTKMEYQQKSIAVDVVTKAKSLTGKYVEGVVRTISIVPPSFKETDSYFFVTYTNPKNGKNTEYFYFNVQNSGSKPQAFGEYKQVNGKMKKRSFTFFKKDVDVYDEKGIFYSVKKVSDCTNGTYLLKKDKLMNSSDIGRLDLVINNRSGSYGRTIKN